MKWNRGITDPLPFCYTNFVLKLIMQLTSKVEHEFTIKLNLAEVKDLLDLLVQDDGQSGKMCYLYDALLVELQNINLTSY